MGDELMPYNYREAMKLENQLCFPLYAAARNVVNLYTPLLKPLGLTYTQYIVMMVLWEEKQVNEKFLCETLCLKSNTITPLLKKLQAKGYIQKTKDSSDERNVIITLTEAGDSLKDRALCVPETIAQEYHLEPEEAAVLYKTLYKILDQENEKDPEKEHDTRRI